MRASRLLTIQMMLETRGCLSAPALARALNVSVRTLYRDVDQLSAAGVPIYASRGRSGGFRLLAGWKATLTGLTPAEAQAVFLSGLTGPAAQLGLEAQVETARLKVLSALPPSWRPDAERISSRLHLDPMDWYRESEPVPHLAAVATAVWEQRQLTIGYESWKARVRRTVHPLGLVLKAGAWYLVAAVNDAPRTFRISSIRDVESLETRSRGPRSFNLARYWIQSIRRFEQDLYKGQAVVLATTAGLKDLRNLSSAVARALAAAPSSAASDERVRVTIPTESIEHAAGQLLRLSPEVEVVEPAALRQAVLERIRDAARRYSAPSAPGRSQ